MSHQYPQPGYHPHQPPMQQPAKPSNMSKIVIAIAWPLSIIASCGIGVAAGGGNSSTTSAAPVVTETVTEPGERVTITAQAEKPAEPKPEQSADIIEDGTWVVGEDIKPGTYKTRDKVTEMCYWSITRSGSNGSDIIANDLPKGGFPRVTLKRGQDFENSCGVWVKVG